MPLLTFHSSKKLGFFSRRKLTSDAALTLNGPNSILSYSYVDLIFNSCKKSSLVEVADWRPGVSESTLSCLCVARTEVGGSPMCMSRVDFGLWFLLFALLDKIDSSVAFLSKSYFYIVMHQNVGFSLFFLMVALRSICVLVSLGPTLIILRLPLTFFSLFYWWQI